MTHSKHFLWITAALFMFSAMLTSCIEDGFTEDKAKTEQYQANAKRRAEQSRFADLESYLYSLDMQLDVIPADEHNLARIAQMTQKTNQFNLTTRRYSESELRQFIDQGWRIYCVSVSDRFGDSGITGAIIMQPLDDSAIVNMRDSKVSPVIEY